MTMKSHTSNSIFILLFVGVACGPLAPIQDPAAKYYVINLDRSPTRLESMREQFEYAGLSFTRIPAVDGKHLNPRELPTSTFVPGVPLNMRQRVATLVTPGEIGCALSHHAALQTALDNMQENKYAVVFEDDVSFSKHLDSQIRNLISELPPDWDILYLGCNANSSAECTPEEQTPVGLKPYLKLDNKCIAGLYAYVVNANGAKKLLNEILPIRIPIDEWIAQEVVSGKAGPFNAYCADPELVYTGDISSEMADRN